MPKPDEKPFAIPKLLVWEAWRQVNANKGAPGVDGQALDEFEADLLARIHRIAGFEAPVGSRRVGDGGLGLMVSVDWGSARWSRGSEEPSVGVRGQR